jgi:hypothetical protein
MKRYPKIAIILLLWSINLFGQQKSVFYNEKRQLIADTNYKISKKQLKHFLPIENLLKQYLERHVFYTENAMNEHDTGYVIVSFKIGISDTLQEIKIEKMNEKKSNMSNQVLILMKKIKVPESAYSKALKDKKYYIAVSFDLYAGKKRERPGFIQDILIEAQSRTVE